MLSGSIEGESVDWSTFRGFRVGNYSIFKKLLAFIGRFSVKLFLFFESSQPASLICLNNVIVKLIYLLRNVCKTLGLSYQRKLFL